MASNSHAVFDQADLMIGQIDLFGGTGSESKIRVTPLSIDAAVDRLDSLQHEVEGINIVSTRRNWAGPGSDAMEQLVTETESMRTALAEMIARTKKALSNAKSEFVSTDEQIASEMETLGEGNLL